MKSNLPDIFSKHTLSPEVTKATGQDMATCVRLNRCLRDEALNEAGYNDIVKLVETHRTHVNSCFNDAIFYKIDEI